MKRYAIILAAMAVMVLLAQKPNPSSGGGSVSTASITPSSCTAGSVATAIAASGALTCTPQYFFQSTDTGGDDTYVIAPTNFPAAYIDGLVVILVATTDNTGACSLDAGPGAKAIKLSNGTSDPSNGDVRVARWMRYSTTANGGAGAWVLPI